MGFFCFSYKNGFVISLSSANIHKDNATVAVAGSLHNKTTQGHTMPSRIDINRISIITPTLERLKELKATLGLSSYEAVIIHLMDSEVVTIANGDDHAE